VFGSTEVYLNGLRSFVRTEESNLGNLSADANLWWARQQDPATSLSLKNGGGIRDSIGAVAGFGGGAAYGPPLGNPAAGKLPGQVSRLDIENALRFNNGLSLLTLTAQQLRDALEWGVAAVAPGATPGQFPQIGGLWLAYNPTNPPMTYTRSPARAIEAIAQPGSRVRTLVATRADGSLDLVVDQGQVIGDPTRTFRMVTLDFLAGGGDSYFALGQGTLRTDLIPAGTIKSFDTPGSEQWAIASYLRTIGNYREPDTNPGLDARIQNLAFRPDTVGAPQLTRLESTGAVSVHFTTLPDRHYEVLSGPSVHGPWTVLNPIPIRGTGAIALLLDSNPDPRHGIYRVRRID
jgi:5'-nucleotidase/UDP-sugar diphosphatase